MIKKLIIGRKDKADFPELNLEGIDIKIDTGAYTSSIHCQEIQVTEVNGERILRFTLLDPSHIQYNNKEFIFKEFKEKRIKSSFGASEKRYIITTVIKIFGKNRKIDLSLSERGEMKFPILIGRRFLMGKFLVNPAKYDLSYKRKIKGSE